MEKLMKTRDAKIAKKAIKILRKDGWCQDGYTDRFGACCMMAAIDRATEMNNPATWSVRKKCLEIINTPNGQLTHWNDFSGRKVEEVIAVLEQVK